MTKSATLKFFPIESCLFGDICFVPELARQPIVEGGGPLRLQLRLDLQASVLTSNPVKSGEEGDRPTAVSICTSLHAMISKHGYRH